MALPTGVVIVDHEGAVRFANPIAESTLQSSLDTLVGHPLGLPLGDHRSRSEIEVPTPGGGYRIVELQTRPVEWDDGDAVLVMLHDVTDGSMEKRGLAEREERYALAIDGARDGLWDWDLDEGTLHLSDRWRALIGLGELPDDDHDPSLWIERTHPDDVAGLLTALESHLSGSATEFSAEHRVRHRDGSYVWMLARGRAVFDDAGEPTRIAGSLTDISDRKRLENELRHEARHDTLTGLGNRRLLLEFLDTTVARAARARTWFTVALIDLDGFKAVNDRYGHDVGDELLVETAHRILAQIRPSDLAARLGGDEFAVVLADVPSAAVADKICARIDRSLREPYAVSVGSLDCGGSLGYVSTDRGDRSPSELLRLADQAMYRSKRSGASPVGDRA